MCVSVLAPEPADPQAVTLLRKAGRHPNFILTWPRPLTQRAPCRNCSLGVGKRKYFSVSLISVALWNSSEVWNIGRKPQGRCSSEQKTVRWSKVNGEFIMVLLSGHHFCLHGVCWVCPGLQCPKVNFYSNKHHPFQLLQMPVGKNPCNVHWEINWMHGVIARFLHLFFWLAHWQRMMWQDLMARVWSQTHLDGKCTRFGRS